MGKASVSILIAICASACSDGCVDKPVSAVGRPAGGLSAVLFERDCGATTGFSSQVSLAPQGAHPSGGGNVFVADTNHGAASAASWGGPWVELRWMGHDRLLIRYDAKARVFSQRQDRSGVSISYEKVER